MTEDDPPDVIALEISDELDLHTFRPGEIADLVPDYLEAAMARGLRRVRIIHGKGTGALRRTVHAALERSALVESYQLAEPAAGGWGATIVWLRRAPQGQ